MSVIVKGGGGKPEEEKTVTAGTSTKVVTPSEGKTIKKVTINPTPSQSKTVTPSTSQQTVSPDSGKLLSQVIVKAMEDVTPEVTAQTPIITQIAENLGVTITAPSGTNKHILQGNNANLLNIKENAKKEGLYVWKKLTAQGGDFIDYVVSDSPTAYPDGGIQGGYWYEKVVEGIDLLSLGNYTKLAVDKFTLSANPTSKFYTNHSLGARPKAFIIFGKATEIKGFEFYAGSFDGTYLYVLATASGTGRTNVSATSTDICLSSSPSVYFESGIEYTLITMA